MRSVVKRISAVWLGGGNVLENVRSFSVSLIRREVIIPTLPLENASIPLKKRPHKKKAIEEVTRQDGTFITLAYATADSYDLAGIRDALIHQNLYETGRLATLEAPDVVHASARYQVGDEPREIFFFKEGATVFWNCSPLEASNVLEFLSGYERERYSQRVIHRERELMTYSYNNQVKKCQLQDSHFVLAAGNDNVLEQYTFSNAMAQSVKLGVWEASLEALAQSIQTVSQDMESGKALSLSKQDVVRKLGALFSLRHRINVESDLLDTPDFYWEQEELEKLYATTIAYFSIARRTRVLNERLSHCAELVELLSGWVADRHHVRLEWMIIVLIMVEVCFELLHFTEQYLLPLPPAPALITAPTLAAPLNASS